MDLMLFDLVVMGFFDFIVVLDVVVVVVVVVVVIDLATSKEAADVLTGDAAFKSSDTFNDFISL